MKKIKIVYARLISLLGFAVAFSITSCTKDEDPTFTDPTITATASQSQQVPGGKVTFTIAVAAEGKLATVKQGGNEVKVYSDQPTTDVITYEYTIGTGQSLGSLNVEFTVTDQQSPPVTSTTSVAITVTETPKETITVDQVISSNTTWSAAKFYLLKGNIYVASGAELTIEPGTIVMGDKVTKGALIVSRGAKIHAKGTAEKPIVFTSNAPKGFRNYGDWGGVVLLGKAQNNQSVNQAIEGISAPTGDNGKYGTGTALGDTQFNSESSGEFYYIRIEFAGIALSTDNELNGLTFGSVGSGTQVHHIQVSYSGDDSYEWFGGNVHTDHLIAYRGWDDDFDTDFGHNGVHQFLVSYRDPNIADKSGSNGLESDNDASGTADGGSGNAGNPLTAAVFANATFFGPYMYASLTGGGALNASSISANYKRGAHIRRNSALQIFNSVFAGSNMDGIFFDNTNAAAVFKGNYVGRVSGNAKVVTPKASNPYDDSNFATDNMIESPVNKVDLTSLFAGSVSNQWNLAQPSALLAATSPLLTGAVTLPAGQNLVQVDYRGAFNSTENWAASNWTNYDPNNTDYGNE